jgi:hypothetical protein
MGMVMEVYAVRDTTLQRLLADPPLVWQLVAPDDHDMYEQARAEAAASALGFFARLFGGKSARPAAADAAPLVLADDEGSVADLDKAWHGLHYLFTGTDEGGNSPLDFLAVGGEEIGTIEVGYGPARALAPPLVAEIATKLASLSDAELRSRFNGPAMIAKKIYPEIWDRDPAEDDSLGYLMENLAGLRKAVSDAARRRQGLVLALT